MSLVLAKTIVILAGIWLVGVGGVMALRPQAALHGLSRMASTNFINYTELLLRILWGLAILACAEHTNFTTGFRVFGMLVVVTGVGLLLVPRRWHAAYAGFWSRRLSVGAVRVISPISIVFGLFTIYAVVQGGNSV